MIVDRLEKGLSIMQALKVEFKHIEVIAIGMQRRDIQFCAFAPVIFVIVIGAHYGDPLGAEDLNQTFGERALSCGAISYNGKDDGTVIVHEIAVLILPDDEQRSSSPAIDACCRNW